MKTWKSRRNLTDERNGFGRFRHLFGDGQHEDGEGQEDGDTERDLLARFRRKAEDEQSQHGHHHAGQNDVVHVIERLPANLESDRQIRKRLWTAAVEDDVADETRFQQLPLAVRHVVGQIHFRRPVCHVHLI